MLLFVTDIPAAVSLPHFYNSDPSLVHEVEGINPVKEKHESIIIMQPVRRFSLFTVSLDKQINLP